MWPKSQSIAKTKITIQRHGPRTMESRDLVFLMKKIWWPSTSACVELGQKGSPNSSGCVSSGPARHRLPRPNIRAVEHFLLLQGPTRPNLRAVEFFFRTSGRLPQRNPVLGCGLHGNWVGLGFSDGHPPANCSPTESAGLQPLRRATGLKGGGHGPPLPNC